jgi:alpha-L-fucosidase|tara:strand:- start:602 stop:901 length:300 start_codon:yes stop_codon:yes gene_type:complete
MAKYSNTSPYFATEENNISLDFFVPRTITAEDDDISYTIDRIYAYRPDLLAYDLYGNPRLWWVFAQRNPDSIEDPVYDFAPGVVIQLPKLSNLQKDLGV